MSQNVNMSSLDLDSHVESVLWTQEQIAERVSALASEISTDLAADSNIILVGVATGAFIFLADLVRKIKLPISVDFIRAESYSSGTLSSGTPLVSSFLKLDITGKHIILVPFLSLLYEDPIFCLLSYLQFFVFVLSISIN